MITIKNSLLAISMALLTSSCTHETIRVSDEVSIIDYDYQNVTALTVATDFKAYVTFSDTEESVRIKANTNLFEKMRVYQEGERLTVKLKNNVSIKGKETLELFVTMPEIRDYKASSDAAIFLNTPLNAKNVAINLSSDAYFEGDITANDFELRASSDSKAMVYLKATDAYMNLSSGADLDGESDVEKAIIKLSSDAVVDLIGAIGNLEATLSSDSDLKDYGLQVKDLKISLSSDSDSYLSVSNTIDVTANSDSRLFYKGDAEIVRQILSSDGKVIKK
ncbi:hypothetical protein DKG77_01335 [Flagellimonas aquimarina]|uniref:Putative auto-transporter adhesin head GIN domain-containing protein n=1 Tax=Flagellimonas aquimarina TaxID=2201895 RepID=A0A316L290_9FLAO|nr:DUF2807 domain-containing protein [Allomuricauda koreensis]PWL39508.1 hypothetical protein DKG77_01335 [Allomuricauda koreensis]